MARIRSVKPEAFTSETLARCSVPARWTFAGLWCYVDDEGRGRSNAGLIKAAVWPLDDDVTVKHVASYLDELEAERLICRYEVDGKAYLHVVNFGEHQHPNRPSPSSQPACSRRTHGGLSEPSTHPHSGALSEPSALVIAANSPNGTQQAAAEDKTAGQTVLTASSVSTHGGRKAKSSSTPPTPTVVDTGVGVGVGDGKQQASPAAAAEPAAALSPEQRSRPITDAYYAAQPMCKWAAINGIVRLAIKSGKYADDDIRAALLRMAEDSQTVTVESLRIELEGLPPRRRAGPRQQQETDDMFARAAERMTGRGES